jgi:hypothetical protein
VSERRGIYFSTGAPILVAGFASNTPRPDPLFVPLLKTQLLYCTPKPLQQFEHLQPLGTAVAVGSSALQCYRDTVDIDTSCYVAARAHLCRGS